VILVTRLNGPQFALNPDLVERADSTPDTVVTLVDGTKYVIAESVDEFIALVRVYRASVLAEAQRFTDLPTEPVRRTPRDAGGKVVPMHPRER
jgi:flagellar protein FlbD